MQGMNSTTVNDEAYEQLKDSCEAIKHVDPDINLDADIDNYVKSLEGVDKHIRETNLETHIHAKLQPEMLKWKRKYAGNNTLLQQIRRQLSNVKQFVASEKTNITNIKDKIISLDDEITLKKDEINIEENKIIGAGAHDLKYEWKKAMVFIVFSIMVAIATYTYFLDNQISLKWSIKTAEEKAATITSHIRKTHDQKYINYLARTQDSCFEEYRNEDTDRLDVKKLLKNIDYYDFSCVDPNKLSKAPRPNIAFAFSEDKKLFILAFSAFLLMLMGKVVAIIYEKMKYPNWLYYSFAIAAGGVLIAMGILSSSLSSVQTEKNQIEKQISTLSAKKQQIKVDYEDLNPDEYSENPEIVNELPEVKKINKELQNKESKLPKADQNISEYSFWVSLLVMLVELVMGAVAWMTYADYIKKKKEVELSGGGYVENLKEQVSDFYKGIEELRKQIDNKSLQIDKTDDMSTKLTTLIGKVHTNEEIGSIVQKYEDSIIAHGKAILQEAETRWGKERMEK